jgi:hypothetical protein
MRGFFSSSDRNLQEETEITEPYHLTDPFGFLQKETMIDPFDPNPFYRSSQRTQRLTRRRLVSNYSGFAASRKISGLNQEISAH